jgi:hypothetical protein
VTPLSGSIPPYSKSAVRVHYRPTQPPPAKGFATTQPTSDQVGSALAAPLRVLNTTAPGMWLLRPCSLEATLSAHSGSEGAARPGHQNHTARTPVTTNLQYVHVTVTVAVPAPQAVRTYEYFAVVELLGLSTKLKLPIRARGMPGGLRLSPPSAFFGDVPTHTWADQLLTVTNTNTLLPARFQARALAAGVASSGSFCTAEPWKRIAARSWLGPV